MKIGVFIFALCARANAISGFKLPVPGKILTVGEQKPNVTEDTPMFEAGLITSFTDDFFVTYNKEIVNQFMHKMNQMKNEEASGVFCDERDIKIAKINMCISEQNLQEFSIGLTKMNLN